MHAFDKHLVPWIFQQQKETEFYVMLIGVIWKMVKQVRQDIQVTQI